MSRTSLWARLARMHIARWIMRRHGSPVSTEVQVTQAFPHRIDVLDLRPRNRPSDEIRTNRPLSRGHAPIRAPGMSRAAMAQPNPTSRSGRSAASRPLPKPGMRIATTEENDGDAGVIGRPAARAAVRKRPLYSRPRAI